MDCQRCPNRVHSLLHCLQCSHQLCASCDALIHEANFSVHVRKLVSKNLQSHIEGALKNLDQTIEQLVEACHATKSRLRAVILQYHDAELSREQETLQLREFQLPSLDALKQQLSSIEFVSQQVSPRRPQSAPKRSQSCRKIEQLADEQFCQPFEKRRFTITNCQTNGIQLKWTHSMARVTYSLEIGIGMRVQGVEQFKLVYSGEDPAYVVNGLQPKTTYRFRVQAQQGERRGEMSDIISLTTAGAQGIEESQFVSKKLINNDMHVQFERPGLILTSNPLSFGAHQWEAKLVISGIIEDLTASLVIGVANKQRKIVGSTINYGYQRESLLVKVLLNLDEKSMIITSKLGQEKFSNIVGPVFPAFQNKNTHKGSGCKLIINFQ